MSIKKKVWNTSTIPSSRETGFWISLLPKSGKIVEATKNKDGILFKVDLANKKRNLYCAQKKALVLTILESLFTRTAITQDQSKQRV